MSTILLGTMIKLINQGITFMIDDTAETHDLIILNDEKATFSSPSKPYQSIIDLSLATKDLAILCNVTETEVP